MKALGFLLWALLPALPASSAVEEARLAELPAVSASVAPLSARLDAPPSSLQPLPAILPEISAAAPVAAAAQNRPAAVQAFLSAARAGARSQDAREFTARAPALFDGLAPEHREGALEGLHELAVAEPKAALYRRTLQDLLIRDELRHIEPRLTGLELTDARRDAVLANTRFRDVKWYHHFWDEVLPLPEGIARRDDLSIGLNVKAGWRKLPSFIGHFRTIFSHEYTHRLQFEGKAVEKYGLEIPPVAAEILRGIELFGLSGLREGKLTAIGDGMLEAFARGRAWARSPSASSDGFYWKGFFAGAAYELALETGRWGDAWAFLRLVNSGVAPAAALEKVRTAAP